MPSVASTHPLWGAVLRSLREMTRLAVAALALAAGLGGATVASAAPPPVHPAQLSVDSGSVALPPPAAAPPGQVGAGGSRWDTAATMWDAAATTPGVEPVGQITGVAPARDAAPAGGDAPADRWSTAPVGLFESPTAAPASSRAAVPAGDDALTGEPGRGSASRRGPPGA